jgi:hypothetical protein
MLTWLGPSAEPAIPELLSLLDSSDGDLNAVAAAALNGIGSASWNKVDNVLRHGTPRAKMLLLANMPHRFAPPKPLPSDSELTLIEASLEQCCHDPDAEVRKAAHSFLSVFRTKFSRTSR